MRQLHSNPISDSKKLLRGFSLTELAIVLVILALLAGYFFSAGTQFIDLGKRKETETKLRVIEAALAGYVAVNGRLPCPADGTLTTGTEIIGCTDNQQNGVVPWVTIGLKEADASDAWNRRITYRVGQYLWVSGGMDMSSCDSIGQDPNPTTPTPKLCLPGCSPLTPATCTPPANFMQAGKGLEIRDATGGTVLMNPAVSPTTGAAYVLISHGRNTLGSFPFGGGAMNPITGSGANEAPNANGVPVVFGTTYFVDRELNEQSGASYFDDIVFRPSIMRVIQQAQRGPRAH